MIESIGFIKSNKTQNMRCRVYNVTSGTDNYFRPGKQQIKIARSNLKQ